MRSERLLEITWNKFSLRSGYILCYIFLQSMSFALHAQEGFQGIIVEKVPVTATALENDPNLPDTAIAYRIFVDLDTNYAMQGVYARNSALDKFSFSTTTSFYNHADLGGTSGKEIFSSFLANDPALAFDSYITINAAANNRLGIMYEEDTIDGTIDGYTAGTPMSLQTIGADFSIPFGTEIFEGSFNALNCAFNVNGGEEGPTESNRVLIGQFTTDGDFSFEINIQIRSNDGSNTVVIVARNPVGLVYQHPDLHYPGPEIEISSPVNGALFSAGENVNIVADVNPYLLKSVEFYVNDMKVFADTVAPFNTSWQAIGDTAYLMAVAKDSLNAIDTSQVIMISKGQKMAPVVSIISPAVSSVFDYNALVNIAANAEDTDGNISLVEFFANDVKVGEDASSPYSFGYTASVPGNVNLTAIATDNDGLKTTSATIGITVNEMVGTDDPVEKVTIMVYPNPVEQIIFIEINGLQGDSDYDLLMLDMAGHLLNSEKVNIIGGAFSKSLNISGLPSGVFQICIKNHKGEAFYSRILKQ